MPSMKSMSLLLSGVILFSFNLAANPSVVPVALKCEYLVNPIGIDSPAPRFTWQLSDARMGARQTGFQLFVGTDSSGVAQGNGNYWNFEDTAGDKSLTTYAGEPLQPFKKYFWAVQVFDMNGEKSEMSEVAFFQTGMMEMKNWEGAWITDTRDIHLKPAPYVRREFEVKKKIKSAQAYIAVGGLYELFINGKRLTSGNNDLACSLLIFGEISNASKGRSSGIKPNCPIMLKLSRSTCEAMAKPFNRCTSSTNC